MENIRSLIKSAIQDHPLLGVVEVTIDLSWYFSRTLPLIELLMEIREQTKNLSNTSIETQRLEVLGKNLYFQSRYVDSSKCLNDARDKFFESQDVFGAAQCSRRIGDILYLHSKYNEATTVLQEARANFIEVGSVLYAARCSQSLGNILCLQSRYEGATAVLKEARVQFTEIGDILGATWCSQSLGNILYMQSRYDEGTDVGSSEVHQDGR